MDTGVVKILFETTHYIEFEKTKFKSVYCPSMGFSITPEEVLRFKQSAVENMDKDQEPVTEQGFAQWVADNVDHNVATLTGKNTFHDMGIICVSEKPLQGRYGNTPRIKERRKPSSFVEKCGVEIIPYPKSALCTFEKLKLDPILYLKSPKVFPPNINYDLWHCSWFLSSADEPRPNWSGFLQCSTKREVSCPNKTTVQFLPIIDMNLATSHCGSKQPA